jgi:hypothetical protein
MPAPGFLYHQEDYDIMFASLATIIDPNNPVCPVIIVRLAAVQNVEGYLAEIIKPPQLRVFPDAAARPALTASPTARAPQRKQAKKKEATR